MNARGIVVLASGGGTLLQALMEAGEDPAFGVSVTAVIVDREGTGAQQRADAQGIPTHVLRVKDFADRAAWDRELTRVCQSYAPTLVVSAGFLKLVGDSFLDVFGGRYLNSHNALLPSFPGIHGPRDALDYGVKVSGATLFVVDRGVDTGAIVAQVAVPVLDDDTIDSLTDRIKVAERIQLVEWVGRMTRDGFTVEGRHVRVGPSNRAS